MVPVNYRTIMATIEAFIHEDLFFSNWPILISDYTNAFLVYSTNCSLNQYTCFTIWGIVVAVIKLLLKKMKNYLKIIFCLTAFIIIIIRE
jgi:hypothetical protein